MDGIEAITESKGKPGGQKKPRVEGGSAIQTDESGSGNEANEKKSTKQSKAAKAVEGEKRIQLSSWEDVINGDPI